MSDEKRRARDRARYAKDPTRFHEATYRWRSKNKDKVATIEKRRRAKVRLAVLEAYGGQCACCGETRIEFLAIDHIEGCGQQRRKIEGRGTTFYWRLYKTAFPSGYRVLCHNCNQSLGHYGYCPHKEIRA